MTMANTSTEDRQALFYPFHLCHERTLKQLLSQYSSVHFRDYMALQVTETTGTTAVSDRMGDYFGELLKGRRIVQGYSVSGPLDITTISAVDRDLADKVWRTFFHQGLLTDRRFQRGLFDLSHGMIVGESSVAGPAVYLHLTEEARGTRPYSVDTLQQLSRRRLPLEEAYDYEYALALVKTSAALVYTIRLCRLHGLEAATDSIVHFRLFDQTCLRDKIALSNRLIPREGY